MTDYKKDINKYLTNQQKQEFIQDLLSIIQVGGKFDELARKYGVDVDTIEAWKDEVLSETAPHKETEETKRETLLDKIRKHDRQGSFDEIKKPVKTGIGVAVAIVIAIVGLRVGLAVYNRPTTFDPFKYTDIKYSGLDGYGTAEVSFDYKSASSGVAKEITKNDIRISPQNDKRLSNGDKITLKVDVAKQLANKKLAVSKTEKTYTVSGLKLGQTVDVFDGVKVSFAGSDGAGTAKVTPGDGSGQTEEVKEFLQNVTYKADPSTGLSTGDNVKVTAEVPEDIIEQYEMVPEEDTKIFKVDKLGKLATDTKDINKDSLKKFADSYTDEVKQKLLAQNSERLERAFGADGHWWTVDQNVVNKSITTDEPAKAYLISGTDRQVEKVDDEDADENTDTKNEDEQNLGVVDSNKLVIVYRIAGHVSYPKSDGTEDWHDDFGPGCVYTTFNNVEVNADGTINTDDIQIGEDNVTKTWESETTVPRSTNIFEQNDIQPYINAGYNVTSIDF